MASQLKNILHFVNIQPGGTQTLPHGLNNTFKKLIPDVLLPSIPGIVTMTADDTNVTLTSVAVVPVTVDVLCESWHTIERAFGNQQTTQLAPQPFVSGLFGLTYLPITDAMTFDLKFGFPGGGGQTYTVTNFRGQGLTQSGPVVDHGTFVTIPFTLVTPAAIIQRVELISMHIPSIATFPPDVQGPIGLIVDTTDAEVTVGVPIDTGSIPPPGSPDAFLGVSYVLVRLIP